MDPYVERKYFSSFFSWYLSQRLILFIQINVPEKSYLKVRVINKPIRERWFGKLERYWFQYHAGFVSLPEHFRLFYFI